MASEIRVNRLSNRSGLSTITFANGGVQFSGITTFANGDFRVGTGATILNPSTNEMQFHTGGSNRFTINNSGANLGTGNITAVDATFTGNVSIAKTLTYEDVKNVDSVGVVTARTGVKITGGDFTVGTAITASSVTGNVTNDVGITTYSGSAVWFKGATANKDMYWSHASGATVYKDNAQILMGDSSDLQIKHDGNHSYIEDTGTGNLLIKSDSVISIRGTTVAIKSADNSQTFIKGVENAGSELYFNNNLRLSTTSTGSKVTGTLELTDSLYWDGDTNTTIDNAGGTADFIRFKTGGSTVMDIDASQNVKLHDNVQLKIGASDDLKLFHSSSSNVSYVTSATNNVIHEFNVGKDWTLQTTGADKRIHCPGNGTSTAVELYHNGSKKIETTSSGIDVTGIVQCDEFKLLDNEHAKFGTGEDLRIYHNGSNGYLKNSTGQQLYRSATHTFENAAGSTEYVRITSGGELLVKGTSVIGSGTGLEVTYDGSSVHGRVLAHGFIARDNYGSHTNIGNGMYSPASNSLSFATNSLERLRIASDGFIGAGTASPRRHFHLHNSATATVGFQMTNGGTGESNDSQGFQLKVGSDGHAEIAQMENSNLRIFTNATERLRITSTGKVVIGDTNTAGIHGTGLRVDCNSVGANYAEGAISLYGTGGDFYAITMRQSTGNGWGILPIFSTTIDRLQFGYYDAESSPAVNKTILKLHETGDAELSDGNLKFANTHGIDFSASESSDATSGQSILNDYEQGTFTAYLYGHSTGSGSDRCTGNGYYTKVGNVVTCSFTFSNQNGNNLNDSEQIRIAGMPFVAANIGNQTSGQLFSYNIGFDVNETQCFISASNASYLRGYRSRNTATWQPWSTTEFTTSQIYLSFNMTYLSTP